MVKKKTAVICGFIVCLAVIVIVAIVVFEKRKTPEPLLKILPDKVDVQIKDVHYTDVAESGMKWEIKAATARYVKKDQVAFFEKIAVRLMTKEGKTFLLTGDQGVLKTDIKDMTVSGNVKILSDNGDTFSTDDLHYINKERRFHTASSVTMENPRIRIRGKGMSLSLEDEKLSLLAGVKAEIRQVK